MVKVRYKIITCILVVLTLFASLTTISSVAKANDNTVEYTDVLTDLNKDNSFNIENYPVITDPRDENVYSLEIIRIAESSTGKLFIYVYQPCDNVLDLNATCISMSYGYSSDGEGLTPRLYDLELISTYNQFDKYLVKNYQVSDDAERYYNIVTIYREFNSFIDNPISGTSEGNEIGLSVGQQWRAHYLDGNIVYEMLGTFETLEIEITYTGNFEFSSGIKLGNLIGIFDNGLSWFVCFNVEEYVVKHIYDADLSYRERSMSWSVGLGLTGEKHYGEWTDYIYVSIKDIDQVSYDGGGLFSKEYTWNRIATGKDFLQNAEDQDVTISAECKKALNESQWVFAFTETEKNVVSSDSSVTTFSTDIDDVAILRVRFFDDRSKSVYDLGVVSDKVNPDNKSDGYGAGVDLGDVIKSFFKIIILLIVLVLVVGLLIYTLPIFVPVLWSVIKWVFKSIVWVITLPFKLIGKLFKKKDKG